MPLTLQGLNLNSCQDSIIFVSKKYENVSDLIGSDGMLPEITSAKTKYSFLENTGIGSIKCEATGKPRPRVTFRRNGVNFF